MPRREGEPPIEVWLYGQDAPSGLDSRRPAPLYRFVKRGDLTVLYVPREIDERFPGRRQDGGLD